MKLGDDGYLAQKTDTSRQKRKFRLHPDDHIAINSTEIILAHFFKFIYVFLPLFVQ